jgi:hypothetical protein
MPPTRPVGHPPIRPLPPMPTPGTPGAAAMEARTSKK